MFLDVFLRYSFLTLADFTFEACVVILEKNAHSYSTGDFGTGMMAIKSLRKLLSSKMIASIISIKLGAALIRASGLTLLLATKSSFEICDLIAFKLVARSI